MRYQHKKESITTNNPISGNVIGYMSNVYMPIDNIYVNNNFIDTFFDNINMYLCTRLYDLTLIKTNVGLYSITENGLKIHNEISSKEFTNGLCITIENDTLTSITNKYTKVLLDCYKNNKYISNVLHCNILFLDFLNKNGIVNFIFQDVDKPLSIANNQKRMTMYVTIPSV